MPEWSVPGYTELRVLGSGGFGEVVLARHDISGIQVAVKYLRRGLLDDPAFAEMFRAEARVLASLRDPHVVRLYEYVETPDGAAIVMELIDGVSLRQILARQGRTSAEAALVVLQGSLLGLAAAHQRGVVHRDYKPENVLVGGDGVSKLTDFGIAARTGDRPMPAGTLAYAPPEQLAGGPATPATDVYAAAATFYECLIGRPPFTGDTAEALLWQHTSQPVPLEPVPVPLRPMVAAGMAKNPSARPPDAASFVAGLNAAAAGAYGPDWESRGRSHLAEAALLLAALWPTAPEIASVGAFVANASQTVDITGNCFGTGNISSAADTAYFRISDLTTGWNACWTNDPGTDSVTCNLSSWTAQEITFSGYAGDYGAGSWAVANGDRLKIQVWNPQSGKGPATCQVVAGSGANNDCT
jgi:eukaryotic-like serine/threonine-protein kinase